MIKLFDENRYQLTVTIALVFMSICSIGSAQEIGQPTANAVWIQNSLEEGFTQIQGSMTLVYNVANVTNTSALPIEAFVKTGVYWWPPAGGKGMSRLLLKLSMVSLVKV